MSQAGTFGCLCRRRVCCLEQPLLSIRGLTGLAVHYMSQIVLASTRQSSVLSQALPQTAELLASLCVHARVVLAAFIRPAVELLVECLRQAVLGGVRPMQMSPTLAPEKEPNVRCSLPAITEPQGTPVYVSGGDGLAVRQGSCQDSKMNENSASAVPGGFRSLRSRGISAIPADRGDALPGWRVDSSFGAWSVPQSPGRRSGAPVAEESHSGGAGDLLAAVSWAGPFSTNGSIGESREAEYRGYASFDGSRGLGQRRVTAADRQPRNTVSSEELESAASDDESFVEESGGDPSFKLSGELAPDNAGAAPAGGSRSTASTVRKVGKSALLLPKRCEHQANRSWTGENPRGVHRCEHSETPAVGRGYVQALLETLEKFSLVADQPLLQETFQAVLPLLTVVIVVSEKVCRLGFSPPWPTIGHPFIQGPVANATSNSPCADTQLRASPVADAVCRSSRLLAPAWLGQCPTLRLRDSW